MSELVAQFELRYPQGTVIRADLRSQATGFSVTTLFGPSGCGKTTVLRALAGLQQPQSGRITFNGKTWFDSSTGSMRSPQERNIGFLFQEYALFPQLTVAENVGYGLRSLTGEARRRQVDELLTRFGVADLRDRYPSQISGGQQQRVALARTLARKPHLLLLDEPLSALDTALREQMRLELRSLLTGFEIPTFLVTHDRHEALALSDHLIVMGEGCILQAGPVDEVFARPASQQVARMVGVETVQPGRIIDRSQGTVSVQVGQTTLIALTASDLPNEVLVCIRAEDVELSPASTPASMSTPTPISAPTAETRLPNQFPATVTRISPAGPLLQVELDCGFPLVALAPRLTTQRLNLEPGRNVSVHVATAAVHLIRRS